VAPMRIKAILVLVIISLFSCSTTQQVKKYREITLNAPNCPLAECRLRYETDPTIWEKSIPNNFYIDNLNKNLFVACYAKTEENEMVQSIIVKPGINNIDHPIDCSLLTVQEAINIEKKSQTSIETFNEKESITEINGVASNFQQESRKLSNEASTNTSENLLEYSLNETILDEKFENEINEKKFIQEDSEEEKAFKENLAQELIDQIETLYLQGLISKESYENEIEIIKNINN
tara:strand:+ start:974 stop:1675 length:702 start_codon:yes stop_codon:yes gene_type:complete